MSPKQSVNMFQLGTGYYYRMKRLKKKEKKKGGQHPLKPFDFSVCEDSEDVHTQECRVLLSYCEATGALSSGAESEGADSVLFSLSNGGLLSLAPSSSPLSACSGFSTVRSSHSCWPSDTSA